MWMMLCLALAYVCVATVLETRVAAPSVKVAAKRPR